MTHPAFEPPYLLGLGGFATTGKSTLASYLKAQYGYAQRHIKTPLVAMAAECLMHMGIEDEDEIRSRLDGQLKNVPLPGYTTVTGRKILQVLGKEFREALGLPTLWLDIWWKAHRDAGDLRVINESVRFEYEAQFINFHKGLMIWIDRPGVGPADPAYEQRLSAHFAIVNDGTTEQLFLQADAIMRAWDAGTRPPLSLTPITYHASNSEISQHP